MQNDDEMTDIVAVRKRKLVIVIDKATRLDSKASTFVYYSLDNKDFNTSTQPGANPRWDYRMVHEIVYNEEFVNTLKRTQLELYLIDDNQPLTSEL
jgi:protein fantom